MSVELPDESQSEFEVEVESQPGGVSRFFLSVLVLGLAITTAVFAYLKDGDFFQGLLKNDQWSSHLIANLHPVLMLLPLGLIVMVLLLEILGWLSFGKWKPATVSALFFAVFTAVLASLSGLVLMELQGNDSADWNQYMWFGIGATLAFAMSFICKIWGRGGNGRGFVYAVFLLAGAGALGYGGYIFGQKVHAYNLVPSQAEFATPFGNQVIREQMSASVSGLETSKAELEDTLVQKDTEISQVASAKKAAEDNYRGEQMKLATAEKKIGELELGVQAAEKKAGEMQKLSDQANEKIKDLEAKMAEGQKQIEAATQEKAALQKVVDDLKGKVETSPKEGADGAEAPPE